MNVQRNSFMFVSLFFYLFSWLSDYYSLWQKPEFTDRKVQSGKEYEYRITAENAGGESGPSEASAPIKASPLKGRLFSNFLCFSKLCIKRCSSKAIY